LQNLIMNQRKTINSLSKMNSELTSSNHKFQSHLDKRIAAYKKQLMELQRFNTEKVKEYESRIMNVKQVLEDKIKEINEMRSKFDKDLRLKNQTLTDLRIQNDKMQKIILSNNLSKRVVELENRIKDYGLERQKLFEDLFKLRGEIDERDDQLSDKNSKIQILQNNLNTLSSQLETLSYLHSLNNKQNAFAKKNTIGFCVDDKKDASRPISRDNSRKDLLFFDKNIVKPIKGGGGNIKNFERNNFLIFDKDIPEDGFISSRGKPTIKNKNDIPLTSARLKSDENFKKFDEILKTITNHSDDDDDSLSDENSENEEEMDEAQKKLKNLSGKPQDLNKSSVKGLFDSVKSYFS